MKLKSVVLLSGGLDSVVNLKMASQKTEVAVALTFDYGQEAARNEIQAARECASAIGIPHKVIVLDWYESLLPDNSCSRQRLEGEDVYPAGIWIPNRNAVFVSIGAAFAEKLGAEIVVMGLNREEARWFPDNSAEFIEAVNRMLSYSTSNSVKLVSYTVSLSKREMVELGIKVNAPLDLIYSCYRGSSDQRMCGECRSCLLLKEALKENHLLDRFKARFLK